MVPVAVQLSILRVLGRKRSFASEDLREQTGRTGRNVQDNAHRRGKIGRQLSHNGHERVGAARRCAMR
jgi:hypothetical protein